MSEFPVSVSAPRIKVYIGVVLFMEMIEHVDNDASVVDKVYAMKINGKFVWSLMF